MGWDYAKIASEALKHLPWTGRDLELINQTPVDTAQGLLKEFGPAKAFAAIYHITAKRPVEDLVKLAKATGRKRPKIVAVGNGFSESAAYLEAIRIHGLEPYVPNHAAHATEDAGFAKIMKAQFDIPFEVGVRMAWACRDGQPMAIPS